MKNNIVYLLIFIVLLGVAGYFISQSETKSTLEGEENYAFAVKDTAAVDKIVISDKSPSSIVLMRNRDRWLLDNKHKVRKDAIQVLLETLYKMELRNFVPKREQEQVNNKIDVYGKEVEIYSNGKKIKHFYVGNEIPSETGTYMKMAGGDQPYAVHIPGFTGFLNTRFFTDPYLWRSRELFAVKAREVREAKMIYPDSVSSSFAVRKFSPDSIYLLNLENKRVIKEANTVKLNLFLGSLKNLSYEAPIVPTDPIYQRRDSLLASAPAFKLVVITISGETRTVMGYRIKNAPHLIDPERPETHFDPDKMHGFINSERMVLLQYYGLRNVLVGPQYFVKEQK